MNEIALTPVKSSHLRAIGFDPRTGTLAVQFRGDDQVYHYYGVSPTIHSELISAPSKGKYFRQVIRSRFMTTKTHGR